MRLSPDCKPRQSGTEAELSNPFLKVSTHPQAHSLPFALREGAVPVPLCALLSARAESAISE